MRILVTGGGTGGHIYPALSIADELKDNSLDSEVLYIGAENGLETRLVPDYGYEIKTIQIKGFIRKICFENLKRLWLIRKALKDSKKIIREFKPDIVIGTGGYVCGPVVLAAAKENIPTAIHEQNAFPGITNKILSKKVDLIFLGFKEAEQRFKTNKKIVYVGNPVRRSINAYTREQAREELGIPHDKKMILAVGGSGGSKTLNKCFVDLFDFIEEKDYAYLHVAGKNHILNIEYALKDKNRKPYQQIKDYEMDIPKYMAAADLVICSAGASTIAEVTAVGRASIIIPKAYTAENHQEYNARTITDNKAGYHILENELSAEKIKDYIVEILDNDELRKEMEENSKKLYPEAPLKKIRNEIMHLIAKK